LDRLIARPSAGILRNFNRSLRFLDAQNDISDIQNDISAQIY